MRHDLDLAPGSVVAIDTSVLLPALTDAGDRSIGATEILDAVRRGRLRALISTIAAAELLVRPIRERWTDRIGTIQAFLLHLPNVTLLPPSWSIAFEASRIRAVHRLQLPDAIIVASALVCDAFVCADRRALAVAEAEGIETIAF